VRSEGVRVDESRSGGRLLSSFAFIDSGSIVTTKPAVAGTGGNAQSARPDFKTAFEAWAAF